MSIVRGKGLVGSVGTIGGRGRWAMWREEERGRGWGTIETGETQGESQGQGEGEEEGQGYEGGFHGPVDVDGCGLSALVLSIRKCAVVEA